MLENSQESSTEEVDVASGCLITHHTRTWDTRIPLDKIEVTLTMKRDALAAAQKAYDDEAARVTAHKVEIQAAVAAVPALPIVP